MKKKGYLQGLIIGLVSASAVTVFANTDAIQTILMKNLSLKINDELIEDANILWYDNEIYVSAIDMANAFSAKLTWKTGFNEINIVSDDSEYIETEDELVTQEELLKMQEELEAKEKELKKKERELDKKLKELEVAIDETKYSDLPVEESSSDLQVTATYASYGNEYIDLFVDFDNRSRSRYVNVDYRNIKLIDESGNEYKANINSATSKLYTSIGANTEIENELMTFIGVPEKVKDVKLYVPFVVNQHNKDDIEDEVELFIKFEKEED